MKKILKRYQERLADLSRRNRAIRLTRLSKRRTFDIASLHAIEAERPSAVVHTITRKGKPVTLLKTNGKDQNAQSALENLHQLRRHVELVFKETGAQECYLGYPFIQGNFHDGTFFRCPLILYPLSIEKSPTGESIIARPLPDREPIINKTFFFAFNKYNKPIRSVDLKSINDSEDAGRDRLAHWAVEFLQKAGIHITALESNAPIIPIPPIPHEEYPRGDAQTITILPYAVIGDFSQANSALSADYDELIRDGTLNGVAELITGSAQDREVGERSVEGQHHDSSETDNFFVTRPDISQERALLAARKGRGILIHGPPGTGKSQLITNLIADTLMRGMRILVVCEKRAALDVVKNRLGKHGLDNHCVLVHDAEADRNAVFKKIGAVLEELDSQEGRVSNANRAKAEAQARQIDEGIERLTTLADLRYLPSKNGLSPYWMYRRSEKDGARLELSNEQILAATYTDAQTLASSVAQLATNAHTYDGQGVIALRTPFPSAFDARLFKKRLKEANASLKRIQETLKQGDTWKEAARVAPKHPSIITLAESYETWIQASAKPYRLILPAWWLLERKFAPLKNASGFHKRWSAFALATRTARSDFSFLSNSFNEKLSTMLGEAAIEGRPLTPFIDELLTYADEFDDIAAFDHAKRQLSDQGRMLYEACASQVDAPTADAWRSAIINTYLLRSIEMEEQKHPELRDSDGRLYHTLRDTITALMRQRDATVPHMIAERIAEIYARIKWEGFDGDGRRKNYNTLRPLLHEVQKLRKRPTLRALNEQFMEAGLLDLFPCWLCSPETTSNIFPLKPELFDIIVYDEASQCKLERAIPSLVRAKRAIIAGDDQQLPPSTFFESSAEEEDIDDDTLRDEERQALEDESLLIRAKYALPAHRLSYHYRSNRQELINFSNFAFYDGRLRIVPRNTTRGEPPITYTNVKGRWSENTNKKEAAYVVSLIKEALKESPELTYGVITFNLKQRELIESMLDEEAAADPLFARLLQSAQHRMNNEEDVGLFVKNIENVQGDERDVIIFSVAYGKDMGGKIRHNFGPLNGIYGKNRLNVAITRAKQAIHLVTSVEPDELQYAGTYEGPRRLQEYLAYCKHVSKGQDKAATQTLLSLNTIAPERAQEDHDTDFEEEVKDALIKMGHHVKTQIGSYGYQIGLGIEHPKRKGEFVVGIECDGPQYHSSKSAKERDIYRQNILEQNGWKILRVWSRDWWRNPAAEARRLDKEIKASL